MTIDNDTSRRGVGWIKLILGGAIVLIIAIPVLMGISGLIHQGGAPMMAGDGTAPAQSGPPSNPGALTTPPAGETAPTTTGSTLPVGQ